MGEEERTPRDDARENVTKYLYDLSGQSYTIEVPQQEIEWSMNSGDFIVKLDGFKFRVSITDEDEPTENEPGNDEEGIRE